MATTLKDIAARTGLSLPTVSHIMSERGGAYREETRQRVWAAAAQLGYRPNVSARAVRSGRYGNLILLMSPDPERSGLFPPLANGILDALDAHRQHLTISRLPDEQLTDEHFLPSVLRTWMGGRVVGRDLSLITFSDAPVSLTGLALDTYVVPMHGMGRRAVDVLLEKINRPRRRKSVVLPLDYVAGESLAGSKN
jgi:DNA-binding LacI/PurR family transcriptional regulator